jgi:hypothetical protein
VRNLRLQKQAELVEECALRSGQRDRRVALWRRSLSHDGEGHHPRPAALEPGADDGGGEKSGRFTAGAHSKAPPESGEKAVAAGEAEIADQHETSETSKAGSVCPAFFYLWKSGNLSFWCGENNA